jgi:PAS domain S-box-containing protein
VTSIPDDLPGRILEGSPDAILVANRNGAVQYWNQGAERIFGFSAAEALGRSMDLIIPERLQARHWAGWKKVMETGITHYDKGQLLTVPARHKDGRELSIEFSIQILKDGAAGIKWVAAVIRDATERFVREKALRAKLKELEGT